MLNLYIILSTLCLTSALMVIFSPNPIHSIFFLILTFLAGSVSLFFINAEFFGFILIIVYVGAIAMLFLFIIMLLHLNQDNTQPMQSSLFVEFFFVLWFLALQFYYGYYEGFIFIENYLKVQELIGSDTIINRLVYFTNSLDYLGVTLYNDNFILFFLAGFILLLTMVGVIVLAKK